MPATPSSKPRLLILASTYPATPGDGTPGFVRDLALQMTSDFDTLVVVPRVPGGAALDHDGELTVRRYAYFPKRWESLADGAIIENLRGDRRTVLQVIPFFVAQLLAVRRAIRDHRPDVLHVHWIVPQGIVVRLAGGSIPRVITTLGGDLYALDGAVMRRVKRWVLRTAGAVTVMNAEMADRIRSLGVPKSRVTVVPMGADMRTLREMPIAEQVGPVSILVVGRLVEKKGIAQLLSALSGIDPSRYTLTVVGDGPLRADLERRASGLPATFAGGLGRSALDAALANAHIVVTPSVLAASGDKDGLPVALLEAMAAGRAIIASDLPGINEAVADGVSGILVPSGDVAALRDALSSLIDDQSARAKLGEAARVKAESFSTDAIGARYRALLASLAR